LIAHSARAVPCPTDIQDSHGGFGVVHRSPAFRGWRSQRGERLGACGTLIGSRSTSGLLDGPRQACESVSPHPSSRIPASSSACSTPIRSALFSRQLPEKREPEPHRTMLRQAQSPQANRSPRRQTRPIFWRVNCLRICPRLDAMNVDRTRCAGAKTRSRRGVRPSQLVDGCVLRETL
jgi:hypothetical protein